MLLLIQLVLCACTAYSFSPHVTPANRDVTLHFQRVSSQQNTPAKASDAPRQFFASTAAALLVFISTANVSPCIAMAEEYEAPSMFTGETVMICTKRALNGACVKTIVRTAENDNDKSNKYMNKQVEPEEGVRAKEQALRAVAANEEGSDLLEKLLQQSLENKEKNEKIIMRKTIANNEGANFGPFSRSTAILNTDGDTYTLLDNPQAMRLKEQGYIKDKKFVKQPSQEVIDAALEPSDSEGIQGVFKLIGGLLGNEES